MRDKQRIEPFLKEFQKLWGTMPDLRFFQIVAILQNQYKEDSFYWEEEKTLQAILDIRRKNNESVFD